MFSPLKVAVLAAVLLGVASPGFAAMRCGTKLVAEGDTRSQVIAKCGEPTDIVERRTVLRKPGYWVNGQFVHFGTEFIEIPIESWIYNLGPNKLMRRIRFEDGIVVGFDTLGYGYH